MHRLTSTGLARLRAQLPEEDDAAGHGNGQGRDKMTVILAMAA